MSKPIPPTIEDNAVNLHGQAMGAEVQVPRNERDLASQLRLNLSQKHLKVPSNSLQRTFKSSYPSRSLREEHTFFPHETPAGRDAERLLHVGILC